MNKLTVFILQELIKEENLDELKEFTPYIKGSELEQEFKRQSGTANLANAVEHIIKNKTNKEVFEISFSLSLQYLADTELGRLIKQCILSEKINYYHYIKESMGSSRFGDIQKSSFLTISSAFDAYPNSAFNDWVNHPALKGEASSFFD